MSFLVTFLVEIMKFLLESFFTYEQKPKNLEDANTPKFITNAWGDYITARLQESNSSDR